MHVLLLSFLVLLNATEIGGEVDPKWALWYSEDFSTPLNDATVPWVLDNYSEPFDNIVDDNGLWYPNDYGPAWIDQLNSFHTYRKEFAVGQDGWLTASLSARDWNKDGTIESPPTLTIKLLGNRNVAEMKVPDHTGGVVFRNTRPLPAEYRIEYKLTTLDFGGKRNGTLEYDNRINGFSKEGCKTRHPWGSGSRPREGWSGNASVPYCEWEDLREGVTGYNGFNFLVISDFADPAPRNNRFWHYRRKVLIDSFSQYPKRFGNESGGRMCDSSTGEYYEFRDSNFNVVNMWISSLPQWDPDPGSSPNCRQWFMSTCSDGAAERERQSAAEMLPEVMPDEFYTFAIERNQTGYTLEASGNFARVGNKTLRFYRPFIVDDVPIWHYNVDPSEYSGEYNNDLVQEDFAYGSMTWPDEWPAGSAYPDYFAIGDVYTNAYEGSASLTDIRLYGLASDTPTTTTPLPMDETVTSEAGEMEPSTTESPVSSGGEEGTNPPDENESPSITSGGYRIHFGFVVGCLILWAFPVA